MHSVCHQAFAEMRLSHFGSFFGMLCIKLTTFFIYIYSLFCGHMCFVLVAALWHNTVMLLQGILVWHCWSCVLSILLPCCIMLSTVLVTFCGQYRSPVPCGVVGSLSVPQRSSQWCDHHVVSWFCVRHLGGSSFFSPLHTTVSLYTLMLSNGHGAGCRL